MVDHDKRATLGEVVGLNVRALRTERGLTQHQLRALLAETGLDVSRSTVNQLELGNRTISVDDLLSLGLVFGIAPHCLLYPEPGMRVGRDDRHALSSADLATWLWSPDRHPLTHPSHKSEKHRWIESLGLGDRLVEVVSEEQVEALQREVGQQPSDLPEHAHDVQPQGAEGPGAQGGEQ